MQVLEEQGQTCVRAGDGGSCIALRTVVSICDALPQRAAATGSSGGSGSSGRGAGAGGSCWGRHIACCTPSLGHDPPTGSAAKLPGCRSGGTAAQQAASRRAGGRLQHRAIGNVTGLICTATAHSTSL